MLFANKIVGLALGGGGGRGLAHIGVLAELEAQHVPIHVIAGTSAGSVIGVLYAAGFSPAQILTLAMRTTWKDLAQVTMPRIGLVSAQRMETLLNDLLHQARLEDLPVPIAAVTCDLYTGREVVLKRGNAALAVRASCAVPGIFPPVPLEDTLLVDGGLVNNVPCSVVRQLGAEVTIGVQLHQGSVAPRDINNIFAVLAQSFDVMQRAQQNLMADVLIVPDLHNHHIGDISKVMPAYEAGRKAVREVLPAIQQLLA